MAMPTAIERSVEQMAPDVRAYVPGYRLKQAVQFEEIVGGAPGADVDGAASFTRGLKVSVFLEIEGAGPLPAEVRRQPRHHDVGRASDGRAAGGVVRGASGDGAFA